MGGDTVGQIVYDARIDTKRLRADAADAENTVSRTADSSGKSMSRFSNTAKIATAAVGGAFALAAKSAITSAADYEQSLNIFRSVSGATAADMTKVGVAARALGQDVSLPGVSAKDAALAMVELSKAGINVNDTLKASKGVLSLAKAGQLDTAEAAGIAANALNAFSLKGEQATKVADLLAAGANASSADVRDMAYSLQMSSASAAAVKVPIEDLTTAIALMANNGVKGSDAGTSLKTMFMNLIPTTKRAKESMKELNLDFYDAKGNFIGMRAAVEQLEKGTAKLTDEQKALHIENIFGADSSRAVNILLKEGVEGYDRLKTSVTKAGAATALAAAQNAGFKGALDGLRSTLETIGIDIGMAVLPALTDLTNFLTKALPVALDSAKSKFDTTIGRMSSLFTDLTKSAREGDWEAVGKRIGEAVSSVLTRLSNNIGPMIGKMFDKLKDIDWLDIGIKVGREAIPFIIGLVAGLLDVDLEKLLKSIWDNLPTILLGLLGLALAPVKLLKPIAAIVSKIPFVGGFIVGMGKLFKGAADWIFGKAAEIVGSFARGFAMALGIAAPRLLPAIMFFLRAVPDAMKAWADEIWQRAVVAIGMVGRAIAETGPKPVIEGFKIIGQTMLGYLDNIAAWVYVRGLKIIDGLSSGIGSVVGRPLQLLSDMVSGILGRFADAGMWLFVSGVRLLVGLRDGAMSAIGQVLGFMDGIGSRVLGALGNMGGLLVGSGRALIDGFTSGIRSAIGSVQKAVGDVMNAARDFFPFSPAKKGPFSGRGYTTYSGAALMQGFAAGMTGQSGYVSSAAGGVLSGAQGALSGGVLSPSISSDISGPGASGGKSYNIQQITIAKEVDGERWLRKLTGNQEIVAAGLVPTQEYGGTYA